MAKRLIECSSIPRNIRKTSNKKTKSISIPSLLPFNSVIELINKINISNNVLRTKAKQEGSITLSRPSGSVELLV